MLQQMLEKLERPVVTGRVRFFSTGGIQPFGDLWKLFTAAEI
jgi:hypothetical protein